MKVAQSCLTLINPMDYSPWNSPGQNTGVGSLSLLQVIFPTQGSNSCLPLSGRFFTAEPPGKHIFPNQGLNLGLPHCRSILHQTEPPGKPKNTGVGSMSLLQGIFPTQESNQGFRHHRQIPYQLSYKGNSINPLPNLEYFN